MCNSFVKGKMIGICDSGLGGISVLKSCLNECPNADYFYYADKANAPYGGKHNGEIIKYVDNIINKVFLPKGVDTVIIACNTATNASVDYLRDKYKDITIIGTEPAIKPSVNSLSEGKKVLVLATESTITSAKLTKLIEEYGRDNFITYGCSGLVELIESSSSIEVRQYFEENLSFLNKDDVDSVVLGCTHYPFIKDELVDFFHKDISFYDGSLGVAKRLKFLKSKEYFAGNGNVLFSSSLDEEYNNYLKDFFKKHL